MTIGYLPEDSTRERSRELQAKARREKGLSEKS